MSVNNQEQTQLRQITPDDIERGVALTQSIGWGHDTDTWQQLIRWCGEGSLGIFAGDQLVASTFALEYSPALAWIGVVVTHPAYQKRGLARRLMTAAIEMLKAHGVNCIMLDATDLGRPLYE